MAPLVPRFQIVPLSIYEVMARLQMHTSMGMNRVAGIYGADHAILQIGQHERTYWSPQLDLEMLPAGEGTQIRALFYSNPVVWGKFVFLYALSALVSFVGLATAVPQYMLDKPLTGLVWLVLGIGLILGVSGVQYIGYKKAQNHAVLLSAMLEAALDPSGLLPEEFGASPKVSFQHMPNS